MGNVVYNKVLEFKNKYPLTVCWRLKAHASVIDKHLNADEKVLYAFCCQKNKNSYEIMFSMVVAVTSKRILISTKKLLFGSYLKSITPDMFNDLSVEEGIIWGKIVLDTVKEIVCCSNIDKRALDEIETVISEYMMEEKKKYKDLDTKKK